ncbi:MAG TPA: glycosyltransferase [Candidatus Rubrimentiphilum sp.]|nr:glycosyltransferase [Candidatus Rubrimentiphilum sp.]
MKLAFVTPWFGENLRGGAERIAFEAAHGLQARGHDVEIITTCSESWDGDWYRNAHRPGLSQEGDLPVRRFRVDRANRERFDAVNQVLLETRRSRLKPGLSPIDERSARDFIKHNINSFEMGVHIRNHADDYAAFIFLPYLYGTTLQGWRFVPEKAVLLPCLHDEAYAYLPRVCEMMLGVAQLAFNSESTYQVAQRLYGPAIIPRSTVVGAAISWPQTANQSGEPIGGFQPESSRYALYLGRRSAEKNVDVLERGYRRFRELAPESQLQLVSAGLGERTSLEDVPGIVDLGFVSEDQKVRLLRNCAMLMQPSVNESYSRVLMEAWHAGRPVTVHADCPPTADAVRETGAGWLATDEQSWQKTFLQLDATPAAELSALGARAADYVQRYASWSEVLDRYEVILSKVSSGSRHAPWHATPERHAVHQVVSHLTYGTSEAIGAIALRDELRAHGFESLIFAQDADEEYAAEAIPGAPPPNGAVVLRNRADLAPVADPQRWNIAPDVTLMSALQDGRTNILFVGEVDEHNGQLDLLEVFGHYLMLDFNARLILAGRIADEGYHRRLREAIDRTGVAQRILLPGAVSEAALAAFYRTASVFCSLSSGRQTLGLPLVEAMWFDIPVCALRTPASQALLGNAGVLIDDTSDRLRLAALLRVLATDRNVREKVVASQRNRREVFAPEAWCRQVGALVGCA